jgi:ribosome-binding ATPase YchF (GTP1/OBG family)
MLVGLVGLPNTGKSTMLKALTLVDVQIANYPFTTVKPNQVVAYVSADCPCKRLGVRCSPQNSRCVDGRRWIPVKVLDVAGLVPGAHEGKGLGNQFLDDLRQASGLIHVLDASGLTDAEGKPRPAESPRDPGENIKILEEEIDEWLAGIIKRNLESVTNLARMKKVPVERLLAEKLSGLGITEEHVARASKKCGIESREFATELRRESKPILIAANKIDLPAAQENFGKMKKTYSNMIPTSADSELALREANEHGLIEYRPGDGDFKTMPEKVNEKQREALSFIRENVLQRYGSTGVQKALDRLVFDELGYIAVYPVASIGKCCDNKGNVLPDANLIPKGTTLKEFATNIHSDIADRFIGGLNLEKKKVGADYELKNGDIVEILFSK